VVRRSAAGADRSGVLLTSDGSLPRGKDSVGRYVEILRKVMAAHAAADGLANQVRWLP